MAADDEEYGELCPTTGGLIFYPFAYALLDEELDNYCWYCLKNPVEVSLKRCTGCRVALFCGKPCLQKAWKDHKIECKAIMNLVRSGITAGKLDIGLPNIEVRLLGRIVMRYKNVTKDASLQTDDPDRKSKRSVMDIWCHAEDMRNDPSAMEKFDKIHSQLTEFYPANVLPDKETIFQLHCRDFINRHAISDKDYTKEIGKGLYLDLCAYDHSCRPNAIYTCDGFVATLRPLNASVDVTDRKKTFYGYVDMITSKQQRRSMLKGAWYFDCNCDRCTDEEEHILSSCICDHQNCRKPVILFGDLAMKDMATLKVYCQHCKEEISRETVTEAIGAMRCIDKLMDKDELEHMPPSAAYTTVRNLLDQFKRILPTVNVYYVKLLQAAIRYCDERDESERARLLLYYHETATDCLRVCYPDNHPALAYHLLTIGRLQIAYNQEEKAKSSLCESVKMLGYVLGSDHAMAKEAESLLNSISPD